MSDTAFPRELKSIEKDFIFSALPERKPGYRKYREKINNLSVIGYGKFGKGNFILGKEGTKPDRNFPPSSIFADGTIVCKEGEIDILIHEEIYDEIEIDISAPDPEKNLDEFSEINRWSYSEWMPGDKAPYDNSEVREIVIKPDEYILAIVPAHKKIWLYEFSSEVNHIIPITNFYNHLMLSKNIRDSRKVTKPGSFFSGHSEYSDEDLRAAYIFYNQYFKKVDLGIQPERSQTNNKSFWDFFKKGK